MSFVESYNQLQQKAYDHLAELISAEPVNLADYELIAEPSDVKNPAALANLPFLTVIQKAAICDIFDVVDQERILSIWQAEDDCFYSETYATTLPHFHVRLVKNHISLEQLSCLIDEIQRIKSR